MSKQNSEVTLVKKYANRRLYNTSTSCYIILEDLFEMVKRGEEFKVVDAKTEEDLTKSVLTQIIFEQESKGYNLLSIDFLRQLISMYGNSQVYNALPNYLATMMTQFKENQEKIVKFSMKDWQNFTPIKMLENIQEQNIKIFEQTFDILKNKNGEK